MATSKIILATALAVMLIVGFSVGIIAEPLLIQQSTTSDPIWDNIVATGKIKVACDPTWPPYESLDSNGNFIGFEVDLVNAVAEKLNLTAEWQNVSFPNIMPLVKDKTLDMGVSGFSVTSERLSQVSFTMPHSTAQRQIIMTASKQASLGITTLASLNEIKSLNLTLGVQSGTTQIDDLTSAGVNYKAFDDFGSAIQDMISANPTVDGVYAETPLSPLITQNSSQQNPIVTVYDAPYYPCAFITNINAHTFTAKVNGALSDIIASGQMDTLKAKWNLTT